MMCYTYDIILDVFLGSTSFQMSMNTWNFLIWIRRLYELRRIIILWVIQPVDLIAYAYVCVCLRML